VFCPDPFLSCDPCSVLIRQRWYPDAALIEGSFRGASGISLRRDIPRICRELSHKGIRVIVFLTDADENASRCSLMPDPFLSCDPCSGHAEFRHATLYGVADRNVECWMASDRNYLARRLGVPPQVLDVSDPKGISDPFLSCDPCFERALGITSYERKEEEVASIVCNAPLRDWLKHSPSFETFYEDARALSRQEGYPIPNERASE